MDDTTVVHILAGAMLMIGLLVIQIVVVAGWGIEPANRRLEELETEIDAAPAPRPAEA